MEVFDNTEMRHYEVTHGEQLAVIEYQVQEKKVFLTRVEFPKSFVEAGKDSEMIASTLDLIEETGMRVVPMTRVIKQYFRDHKERRKLLPVGIHL
jgi:predicted GNAT family acetyltransferase